MEGLGLGLALSAAVAWAGLDATRKRLVRELTPLAAAAWLTLGLSPVFAVWAALAGGGHPGPAYWAPGAVILAFQALANVLFFRALALSPLSATIPFLSLTPVFTSLIALGLLGERPSPLQWAGIALTTAGALLVNAGKGKGLWASLRSEPGSLLMVAVAALWSVTGTLDKVALEHASLPWHAALQTAGAGLVLAALALRRGGARRPGAAALRFLGVSLGFAAAALALQLAAIQLLLVAAVETLKRALGMISSVVLGRLLFGERIGPAALAAILLMVVGSTLLALGG